MRVVVAFLLIAACRLLATTPISVQTVDLAKQVVFDETGRKITASSSNPSPSRLLLLRYSMSLVPSEPRDVSQVCRLSPSASNDTFCLPSPCGGHYYRPDPSTCRQDCGGATIYRYISHQFALYYQGYLYPGGDACQGCGPCQEAGCYHWEDIE